MADYPDDLHYSKDHEWTRVQGGSAVVGITWFAQDQLGDVVFVELPEPGAKLEKGKPFGVVESTKAVSELFAPMSGTVVKVNKAVVDAPESINQDPHGKAWMIEVQIADARELEGLLTAAQYREHLKSQGP